MWFSLFRIDTLYPPCRIYDTKKSHVCLFCFFLFANRWENHGAIIKIQFVWSCFVLTINPRAWSLVTYCYTFNIIIIISYLYINKQTSLFDPIQARAYKIILQTLHEKQSWIKRICLLIKIIVPNVGIYKMKCKI